MLHLSNRFREHINYHMTSHLQFLFLWTDLIWFIKFCRDFKLFLRSDLKLLSNKPRLNDFLIRLVSIEDFVISNCCKADLQWFILIIIRLKLWFHLRNWRLISMMWFKLYFIIVSRWCNPTLMLRFRCLYSSFISTIISEESNILLLSIRNIVVVLIDW